ncbi:MAG: hypothetical protein V7668_17180 [Cereibacter changlensis]|uniref:hypothetical protein n=1 Tax=Cereibacter changlensis TaxID=402884 RepID=UPI00304DA2AC
MSSYSDQMFQKKASFRLAWPFFLKPAAPAPQKPAPLTLTKEELRQLFSADLATAAPGIGRVTREG